MQKSRFAAWYVKYIIKSPLVFYTFLSAGVVLFIALSLGVRLDIAESTQAEVQGQQVVLDREYELASDTIYLYQDRNEQVYKLKVAAWKKGGGSTVCTVEDSRGLLGRMNADVVTGSHTLLERIFMRGRQA